MITLFNQNRIRKYYYFLLFPIYYLIGFMRFLKLVPPKYILFGSGGGTQFIDNSKYAYLFNRDQNKCIWITHSKSLLAVLNQKGYRAYLSYSIHGIFFQLFSQLAVVSHGTFDLTPTFLLNVPVLQYWHGCPIKKIGLDVDGKKEKSIGDKIWNRIFKVYPHLNNYYSNYFVDHSKQMNYHSSFDFSNPTYLKIPYPRLIPLYHDNYENECQNDQLSDLAQQKLIGKKIIVYMPTYREGADGQIKLEEQILNLAKDFEKDNRFIFVYKSHFVLNEELNNDHLVFYRDKDPYPLLKLSDGLITDYSSIVFDYLPSKKPITMFVYDKDIYKSAPGFYYDIELKFASILTLDHLDVYKRISQEIFGEKPIEKSTIFRSLFYKSFYEDQDYDIYEIKQKYINGRV